MLVNMNRIAFVSGCVVLVAALGSGCAGRQPVEGELPERQLLPGPGISPGALDESWLTLSESDWRVKALDSGARAHLTDVKKRMADERRTQGYLYYGRYSAGLQAEMESVQRECDQSLLVSAEVISRYPTPELYSIMQTHNDKRRADAVNYNTDLRAAADDWARVWLADEPVQGNPTPVVSPVP